METAPMKLTKENLEDLAEMAIENCLQQRRISDVRWVNSRGDLDILSYEFAKLIWDAAISSTTTSPNGG